MSIILLLTKKDIDLMMKNSVKMKVNKIKCHNCRKDLSNSNQYYYDEKHNRYYCSIKCMWLYFIKLLVVLYGLGLLVIYLLK